MLLIAATAVSSSFAASSQEPVCPETVNVQQVPLAPPAGWKASLSDARHRLETVTFFNGPPEEQALLVYDRWTRGKTTSVATWTLPRDARGYWIRCSYSATRVALSRKLAPAVSKCEVTYDQQSSNAVGLPAILRIVCE
ncbi:MAG TPA: STY0301 family protein [Casimicrobiaceae bacterium]|nr:STY0301 family protein [Casimicrobiaceae bacterium]